MASEHGDFLLSNAEEESFLYLSFKNAPYVIR